MFAKRLIQLILLAAILGSLTLSLPVTVKAQDNALCGYFQDDGYVFYTFYPFNGYEPIPALYSAENFESTFGFRIDSGITWLILYDPTINRGGTLTGFSSFRIVDSCGYAEPSTPTAVPIMEFTVDDATITRGECTTLRWTTNEAYEQVFLDSSNGAVFSYGEGRAPASGEATVCPSTNSTYRLTGAYGITQDKKEITIYVFEPTDTSVPPTAVPTRTAVPPTRTALPTFTAVPPSPKPISTLIVPSSKPISTLVVPSPVPQKNTLELSVAPIRQLLSPTVTLSNGLQDDGSYDCFIASMSMALEYFRAQNILSETDTTNYRALIPIVRGTTDPGTGVRGDPAFVSTVTNEKLSARPWYSTSENLPNVIETELRAGRPVVSSASHWDLPGTAQVESLPHSLLLYGLHDETLYYIDPWDGKRHEMPIQDFVAANSWPEGAFVVLFSNPQ